MAGFSEQINLVLKLLLLMVVGFFLRRKNVINAEGKKVITDLVLYITLPCSILNSFMASSIEGERGSLMHIFIISIVIQFGSLALSKVLFIRSKETHRDSLEYGIVVPNSGILGTPISEGLFGEVGVLLASVYLIPMRLMMWTFGMAIFTKKVERNYLLKAITHPCILAVFIGMTLMLCRVELPRVIESTISSIGVCNTALSLILVGTIMGDMDLKLIFHPDSIYFAVVRLILIPFIVFLLCNLAFGGSLAEILTGVSLDSEEKMIRNVCVILAGMPAGSTTPIMALKYGSDESFGSAIVALTTTLSLAAIPLWCSFLS